MKKSYMAACYVYIIYKKFKQIVKRINKKFLIYRFAKY